jgi:hypothetical protein
MLDLTRSDANMVKVVGQLPFLYNLWISQLDRDVVSCIFFLNNPTFESFNTALEELIANRKISQEQTFKKCSTAWWKNLHGADPFLSLLVIRCEILRGFEASELSPHSSAATTCSYDLVGTYINKNWSSFLAVSLLLIFWEYQQTFPPLLLYKSFWQIECHSAAQWLALR